MFAMSGGIAGDGVVGLEGDAGAGGAGVLPQASRNRRMSASLVSGGGEKLGGEGARGDMGFWVSGRVWLSTDSGDFGGGVDSGKDEGGEEDVEEVSTVEELDEDCTGESWLRGLVAVGVRARRLDRCISKCC
jgi:hypothetical protein